MRTLLVIAQASNILASMTCEPWNPGLFGFAQGPAAEITLFTFTRTNEGKTKVCCFTWQSYKYMAT